MPDEMKRIPIAKKKIAFKIKKKRSLTAGPTLLPRPLSRKSAQVYFTMHVVDGKRVGPSQANAVSLDGPQTCRVFITV